MDNIGTLAALFVYILVATALIGGWLIVVFWLGGGR